MADASDIGAAVLGEAADWLVRFQSGEATEEDRHAFQRWRAQSPQHDAAWQRAESVMGAFGRVPARIGRGTLAQLGTRGRRRTLQWLGACVAAVPAAWLAWRHRPAGDAAADLRTAIGERRAVVLADGSNLVLNTDSAVALAFSGRERRLRLLAGEILVTTAADPAPAHRPFVVQTPQGDVRALGTRFSVRRLATGTRVAVFDDAVLLQAHGGASLRLRAGEQTVFDAASIQPPRPVDATAALWERGMLVARRMRLGDLAAELARYRAEGLECAPEVAQLPVSGAFALADTDAALRLLAQTLPVRIVRRGSRVRIEAR